MNFSSFSYSVARLSHSSNDTLSEAIERLLKADADYRAFVRTTRSHQLAAEGAREALEAIDAQEAK
jgi:hypothetical protein